MDICVYDLSGECTPAEVRIHDKVCDLKKQLGYSLQDVILEYEGEPMEDNREILSYGLTGDCTLTAVASDSFLRKERLLRDFRLNPSPKSMKTAVLRGWTEAILLLHQLNIGWDSLLNSHKPVCFESFKTLLELGVREPGLETVLGVCISDNAHLHVAHLIECFNVEVTSSHYRKLTSLHGEESDLCSLLLVLLSNEVSEQIFWDRVCSEYVPSSNIYYPVERSLFYRCVSNSYFEAASFMCVNGRPNMEETDDQGRYSWFHVNLHHDLPSELKSLIDVKLTDNCGRTFLYYLIQSQGHLMVHSQCLPLLSFATNAEVVNQATTNNGFTPLHLVWTPFLASFLISQGADVNKTCFKGRSPLFNAIVNDRPDVCAVLLRAGADPNLPDLRMKTAVHHACSHGRTYIVLMLLAFDGDLEARDEHQKTAIFHSVCHGHHETTSHIVVNGADKNAVDKNGRKATLNWYFLDQNPDSEEYERQLNNHLQ
eukprot:TRINITY_DN22984_c0_g1_i1.p1 TRINITY_DN22984_c0_g1~~TRINITY_DN22984_c0_g1_i1.p1  ORF type:complete len:484 (+),score=58.18 TRINITY_DN22984_c0_g1_i1:102-1553(+)